MHCRPGNVVRVLEADELGVVEVGDEDVQVLEVGAEPLIPSIEIRPKRGPIPSIKGTRLQLERKVRYKSEFHPTILVNVSEICRDS